MDRLQKCFEYTDWDIFKQTSIYNNHTDLNSYTSSVLDYVTFCMNSVTTQRTILTLPNHKPCQCHWPSTLTHFDQRESYVGMLFIDHSSAFNAIPPPAHKLAPKLDHLGLNTHLSSWVLDSLTGRPQTVRMGRRGSSSITLSIGAPQGRVLSPFLFSIYTLDPKPSHEANTVLKFADDTIVVDRITSNDQAAYRTEEENLVSWRTTSPSPHHHRWRDGGGCAEHQVPRGQRQPPDLDRQHYDDGQDRTSKASLPEVLEEGRSPTAAAGELLQVSHPVSSHILHHSMVLWLHRGEPDSSPAHHYC